MCEIAELQCKIADLCSVQILVSITRPKRTAPIPTGSPEPKLKVCVMSLMKNFDRIAPVYLLALGVFAAISTAGLGA